MDINAVYVRFKSDNKTRKELGCLHENLFDYTEEIRVSQFNPNPYIPKGYYLLVRTNEKPIVPEGKSLGYKFKIEDGVMKRAYIIAEGRDDPNLLVIDDYEEAVQDFLDKNVQKRGYDNVYTCLSYMNDPFQTFSEEADTVLNWRSDVWRTAQGILNAWAAGQMEQPTIQEVLARLPPLGW